MNLSLTNKNLKSMKAIIISINPKSSYAKYKGMTFNVKQVLSTLVALDINGVTVDFTHKEVAIVDFAQEIQNAYDRANWNSSDSHDYNSLTSYAVTNKLAFNLTYNCPS